MTTRFAMCHLPIIAATVVTLGIEGCSGYADQYYYYYYGEHSVRIVCKSSPVDVIDSHNFTDKLDYHVLPKGIRPSDTRHVITVSDTCGATWLDSHRRLDSQMPSYSSPPDPQRQLASRKNPDPEEVCAINWSVCGMPVQKKYIDFYGPPEIKVDTNKDGESVTVSIPCRIADSETSGIHKPGLDATYRFSGILVDKYHKSSDPADSP